MSITFMNKFVLILIYGVMAEKKIKITTDKGGEFFCKKILHL